jgi:alkylhydroperoxidase family enzyme
MPQWDILKMPWVYAILGCDLIKQQKKVVNLAVSQLNGCKYCQAAHATGKMNGYGRSDY